MPASEVPQQQDIRDSKIRLPSKETMTLKEDIDSVASPVEEYPPSLKNIDEWVAREMLI